MAATTGTTVSNRFVLTWPPAISTGFGSGIGRPPGRQSAADYVLAKLRPNDLDALRVDAAVAADAVEFLLREAGVDPEPVQRLEFALGGRVAR